MKYLEEISKTGAKESDHPDWQPLFPITDPPVVNQISAINNQGIGEINLLSFSSRALWEHTQEHKSIDKEIPIDPQAFALMRSTINDQMTLFVQLYSILKPSL